MKKNAIIIILPSIFKLIYLAKYLIFNIYMLLF